MQPDLTHGISTGGIAEIESRDARRRPAAYLDRDGVLNVDSGYVHRPEELRFTPTAIEAIGLLNDAGYRIIVVTNQSGVARGLYGVADVERFHQHMQNELARHSVRIDAFYWCPYHPDGVVSKFRAAHADRKPEPGMILRAMADWPTDRERSFLIGDQESDIEAARRAGIRSFLVLKDECDLAATVRLAISCQ